MFDWAFRETGWIGVKWEREGGERRKEKEGKDGVVERQGERKGGVMYNVIEKRCDLWKSWKVQEGL